LQIFKTKAFGRFQRRERITDAALIEAVERAERGLVDADLGRGLIKQRVARAGQGRRSGFRTIIAYQLEERAMFLYGFAKNQRANLNQADEHDLAALGETLINASDEIIQDLLTNDDLKEVL